MWGIIIGLLIVIGTLVYQVWWKPKVCRKIISDKIIKMGGEVIEIEQLSIRDEIYKVIYRIESENRKSIVKFKFMNEEEWK